MLLSVGAVGCTNSGDSHHADKVVPASFEAVEPPHETDLVIVRLTPEAVSRLGITTVPVEQQPMPRRRTIGGDISIPAGSTFIVSAPIAGTVDEEDGVPFPIPGSRVTSGSPVVRFTPLLSPERDVPTPAELVAMANARDHHSCRYRLSRMAMCNVVRLRSKPRRLHSIEPSNC